MSRLKHTAYNWHSTMYLQKNSHPHQFFHTRPMNYSAKLRKLQVEVQQREQREKRRCLLRCEPFVYLLLHGFQGDTIDLISSNAKLRMAWRASGQTLDVATFASSDWTSKSLIVCKRSSLSADTTLARRSRTLLVLTTRESNSCGDTVY